MAEKTFKLEIVTPERLVYSANVASVVVPGSEGSLGILANHAPLMAELTIGKVTVRDADGHISNLAISGGFMEVEDNVVRILADAAELAGEIDVERAESARQRAAERLRTREGVDTVRAEAALRKAMNRLKVAREE